jgi:hypothetical protein
MPLSGTKYARISMDAPFEEGSRWGGDSNAEWMTLAAEVAGIGTWEFDLEQGTGFISERCSEIMGQAEL